MPRTRKSSSTYYQFHDNFEDDTSFDGAKNEIQPLQRNAANARERSRMRVLSSAFGRLKTKLPNIPPDTKLSKLDTLRLATLYIKQLKTLAEDVNLVANAEKGVHFETPVQIENIKPPHFQNFHPNMTWPFAFQHIHITNRNIEPNLSVTNWEEVSENLQDKSNRKSNMSSLNEVIRSPDLFENTDQINTKTPDSSNCFDCVQSQQQISPCINRTHYNYHSPYCSDQQHQDIQINL